MQNVSSAQAYVRGLMETRYENVDEMMRRTNELYPDLRSSNLRARTMACSQVRTEWAFSAPSFLEANLHSRYPDD